MFFFSCLQLAKIREEFKIDMAADEFGGPFLLKLNLKSFEDTLEYDKIKIGMVCAIVIIFSRFFRSFIC
jgi:hypothetical protein